MRKKKITVIDNDKWNARVISSYIIQWNMESGSWCTAVDGLAGILNDIPDLIILDLMLTDVKSVTLLQILKKIDLTKDIPVLVTSSNLNRSILRQALSSGASGVISKPFSQKTLFEKIISLIGQEDESEESDDFIDIDISALSDELIEEE